MGRIPLAVYGWHDPAVKGRHRDGLFIFPSAGTLYLWDPMQATPTSFMTSLIARETGISEPVIQRVLALFADGATLPFIARYRKEVTGGLDELGLSLIQKTHQRFLDLESRKQTILHAIEESGALSPDLKKKIEATWDATILEDIYLPYKKKKKTRASIARERGLEPLANLILSHKTRDLERAASNYIGEDVPDTEAAMAGARDILAEWFNDDAGHRDLLRRQLVHEGTIVSRKKKGTQPNEEKFRDYFEFDEPLRKIPSHRFLAARRGEKEGILRVQLRLTQPEVFIDRLARKVIKYGGACADQIRLAMADSFDRLMMPSLENEVMSAWQSRMDDDAITVFAQNLRQLLLSPPLGQVPILALDPGYRTGCKIACLNSQGDVLEVTTIYPLPPRSALTEALNTLDRLIHKYGIRAIATGDGTGGKEVLDWLRQQPFSRQVEIYLVSESGASIYSASEVAREEFPDLDLTFRSAASIGRRLMDPLAELVKIDPKSIGVGQYQHDVHQGKLKQSLDETTQFVVNQVGVQINTASEHILRHIAGLGPVLARNIVQHRHQYGPFPSRSAVRNVERMGARTFEQCAGFLRVRDSEHPLDNTGVHPERYALVERIAKDIGLKVDQLIQQPAHLDRIQWTDYVHDDVGMPTLQDIRKELTRPGHDPRGQAQSFRFTEGLNDILDIREGMILQGLISNLTNFGAFVQLGIKEDGMIHISQLTDRFIRHPSEVVHLQQAVSVRVLRVDISRKRIDLTLNGVS